MKGLVWALALGGFFALGCGSGQTGSASCAPTVACQCQRVAGQYLAKAMLLDLGTSTEPGTSSTTASIEIQQVLNPDIAFNAADVQRSFSGHSFSFPIRYGFPECKLSTDTLRVGDSVLVTVASDQYRSDVCPAYALCINQRNCRIDGPDYSTCIEPCLAACMPDRSGDPPAIDMVLTPWADAIEVGNGSALALSDAVAASDPETCAERFPPPNYTCDDVRSDDSCAFSGAARQRGGSRFPWLAASLLAGLLGCRGRRRARNTR